MLGNLFRGMVAYIDVEGGQEQSILGEGLVGGGLSDIS